MAIPSPWARALLRVVVVSLVTAVFASFIAVGAPGERTVQARPMTTLRPHTRLKAPRTSDPTPRRPVLRELVPGTDFATWFATHAGHQPSTHYFGAYSMEPLGETLHLGFGAARPAESDGSLFATFAGDALQAVFAPSEQGFIDMQVSGGTVFFPGPDPCCPDGWDWGNFYSYEVPASVDDPPNPVVKHRNLPNVIHSWGLWVDEQRDDTVFVAVSSHMGDYKTWTGEVFKSTDRGESWQPLANRDDGVGQYRTYDIVGLNGKLYVTWNDTYPEPCGLAESLDGGLTWTRFPLSDAETLCRSRLSVIQGQVLALEQDRTGYIAIDGNGNATRHEFSGLSNSYGFTINDWAYNPIASDDDGVAYAVAEDGQLIYSSDLLHWRTLLQTDLDLITAAYWPDRNWLILADRGADAKVWYVDLGQVNRMPVARADEARTAGGAVAVAVLDNDWDPDGDALHLDLLTPAMHGRARIIGGRGGRAQRVLYVSERGFEGVDAFSYTISDGKGGFASATVTVTVE